MISPATIADNAQWLADRRTGIGASEAAAIVGLSPWLTPLEIYLDKVGLLPEKQPTPRMRWGLKLQPFIADCYSEETGRALRVPPPVVRHPLWSHMLASADYLADDRVVEIKRVSRYAAKSWGDPGTDEVPIYYTLQVQQQMACFDLPLADIAAFFGEELAIYTISRCDRSIANLLSAEKDFWGHVERREPPLPDFYHPTTADLLASLEPEQGATITLSDETAALASEYQALGQKIRSLKKSQTEYKSRILHALNQAEVGYLPDGRTITRRLVERAGYTVAPTSYFDLRIKEPQS